MPTKKCRLCHSERLVKVIDLGFHPLADTFLTKSQLSEKEVFYPLCLFLCRGCGHLMSGYIVSKEERYQKNEYSYDSANSLVAVRHFNELAQQIVTRLNLSRDDLVVDIGSNVGTLLGFIREKSGCNVIGVEPAPNISFLAGRNKIPTIQDFFNEDVVRKILKIGKARVITATNVFNHIDDINDFIKNIDRLLINNGVFVFEVPYLVDLIKKTAFDTIYLEHVSYFSVKPYVTYFNKLGFYISNLERNDYMGGSIRVYLVKNKKFENKPLIRKYIKIEEKLKIHNPALYKVFMVKTRQFRYDLNKKLYNLKTKGVKIIGIGAATKGNTLLNYCKIDQELLEYVIETSPLKIGKYTPGSHIKIINEKEIDEDITHALILPWNIANFLVKKLRHLRLKFIIPHT